MSDISLFTESSLSSTRPPPTEPKRDAVVEEPTVPHVVEHPSLLAKPWHGLWYTRRDVDAEFVRFMARDLIPSIISAMYGCVIGSYVFLFRSADHIGKLFLGLSLTLLLLGGVSAALHLKAQQTASIAAWRYRIATIVTALAVFAMSFVLAASREQCAMEIEQEWNGPLLNSTLLFNATFAPQSAINGTSAGGQQPTALQVLEQCYSTIESSTLYAVVGAVVFIRLRTVATLLIAISAVPFFYLGTVIVWPPVVDVPQGYLVVKMIAVSLGAFTAALFGGVRDALLRRQFEQHLQCRQATAALAEEKRQVQVILETMIPNFALQSLIVDPNAELREANRMGTVFMAQVFEFSKWTGVMSEARIAIALNSLYLSLDQLAATCEVVKVKTVGDLYIAVAGLPDPALDHAQKAIGFGLRCQTVVAEFNAGLNAKWPGLKMAYLAHSGPISGCLIGSNGLSYEVFGHCFETTYQLLVDSQKDGQHEALRLRVPSSMLITDQVLAEMSDEDRRDYTVEPVCALVWKYNEYNLSAISLNGELPGVDGDLVSSGGLTSSSVGSPSSGSIEGGLRSSRSSFASESVPLRRTQSKVARLLNARTQALRSQEGDGTLVPMSQLNARSEQEFIDKIAKPKYKYLITTYEDSDMEKEYRAFALEHLKACRIAAIIVICLVAVFCLVSHIVALEDLTVDAPAYLAVSILVSLVSPMSIVGVIPPSIEPFCNGVACIGISASVINTRESVISRDPTWLLVMIFMPYGLSLMWLPSFYVCVILAAVVGVPVLVAGSQTDYFGFIVFSFISLELVSIPIAVILERLQRQQYVENRLSEFHRSALIAEHHHLTTLISSVVPIGISQRLQTWLSTNPQLGGDPLQHSYQQLVMGCFVVAPLYEGQGVDPEFIVKLHRIIDEELRNTPQVVKVKSLGNMFILAGPVNFGEEDTTPMAPNIVAKTIVRILLWLNESRSRFRLGDVTAGLHAGPATGAVLGLERMAFDILGPAVDKCIKVQQQAQVPGDILATRDFMRHFIAVASEALYFGPMDLGTFKEHGTAKLAGHADTALFRLDAPDFTSAEEGFQMIPARLDDSFAEDEDPTKRSASPSETNSSSSIIARQLIALLPTDRPILPPDDEDQDLM